MPVRLEIFGCYRKNKTLLRTLVAFATVLSLVIQVSFANAEKIVQVVGYTFPPFVSKDGTEGLTTEFLTFLNKQQSTFRFEFSKVPPNRRYWMMKNQIADLILFEMPEWGWGEYADIFDQTQVMLLGGEVFIAHSEEGRNQTYFDEIKDKSIAGVFGYHYGFAGFNNDRDWLEKNFSIFLTDDPENVITMVIKNRADVGVVTQAFLSRYLSGHPEAGKDLLISETTDQEYRLRALIGKHSPISAAQFEAILEKAKASGDLQRFFDSMKVGGRLVF